MQTIKKANCTSCGGTCTHSEEVYLSGACHSEEAAGKVRVTVKEDGKLVNLECPICQMSIGSIAVVGFCSILADLLNSSEKNVSVHYAKGNLVIYDVDDVEIASVPVVAR